jgi:hypothetical protein
MSWASAFRLDVAAPGKSKIVQVRGASSRRNPRDTVAGGIAQTKMVRAAASTLITFII